MSSTTGTNYFTKSMNSIIEIDDGAGTVISDGIINCNSFSSTNFSTNNLNSNSATITTINGTTGNINNVNSTTISNSGTTTTNIINASTSGTIPLLNSTTINNTGTISSNIITATTSGTIPILNSTTINNSGTTTTGTMASTTINNTGTATTNVLHATTAVITDISGNNADYNYVDATNFTGLNSIIGTLTNQSITALTPASTANLWTSNTGDINIGGSGNVKIQNIQPTTPASTTNLFTNSSNIVTLGPTSNKIILNGGAINLSTSNGSINVGGDMINLNASSVSTTGQCYLSKTGNYYIETGTDTSTANKVAFIDFHSSGNANNYDGSIFCQNGTTQCTGELFLKAKDVNFRNASDVCPNLYLGTSLFRYIPWTVFYTATYTVGTVNSNFINFPIGANCPSGPTGSVIVYRYSVIGNSMYLNFHYYQPTFGLAGSGTYQYLIPFPSGYSLNTTGLLASGTTTPTGTRLGSGNLKILGSTSTVNVGVFWTQQNAVNGLMLYEESGSNVFNYIPNSQSSGRYSYAGTGASTFNFEAIIPV